MPTAAHAAVLQMRSLPGSPPTAWTTWMGACPTSTHHAERLPGLRARGWRSVFMQPGGAWGPVKPGTLPGVLHWRDGLRVMRPWQPFRRTGCRTDIQGPRTPGRAGASHRRLVGLRGGVPAGRPV